MARTPNPTSMSTNYKNGISNGGTKYKQGIQDCQVNPMALAAQAVKSGKFLAAVTDAVNSGRMEQHLLAVDPSTWKNNAMNYGTAAYTASAAKASTKYNAVVSTLAAAGAKASSDAAAQSAPLEKVRAAINAMKSTFGKSTI